ALVLSWNGKLHMLQGSLLPCSSIMIKCFVPVILMPTINGCLVRYIIFMNLMHGQNFIAKLFQTMKTGHCKTHFTLQQQMHTIKENWASCSKKDGKMLKTVYIHALWINTITFATLIYSGIQ